MCHKKANIGIPLQPLRIATPDWLSIQENKQAKQNINKLEAHKMFDPAKLPKNWSHPWRARSSVWLRSQTGNYLQFQGRWRTISCPQYKYSLHLLDCWGTGLPVSFQQRDWIYSNSTSMYKKGKGELLRSNEASGWLDCRPNRWSLYWSLDFNWCTMYHVLLEVG